MTRLSPLKRQPTVLEVSKGGAHYVSLKRFIASLMKMLKRSVSINKSILFSARRITLCGMIT